MISAQSRSHCSERSLSVQRIGAYVLAGTRNHGIYGGTPAVCALWRSVCHLHCINIGFSSASPYTGLLVVNNDSHLLIGICYSLLYIRAGECHIGAYIYIIFSLRIHRMQLYGVFAADIGKFRRSLSYRRHIL